MSGILATAVREVLAVVSNSTGKDSGIATELAIEKHGRDHVHIAAVDTGNEHELFFQHLGYMRERYGDIVVLRAEFSEHIARKRRYVETTWRAEGVPEVFVQRALSVLQPTGVPFLDLCLWKGRFPSRIAQFCTQELKRIPLDRYLIDRMADGYEVESWRGIRRDESHNRRNAVERERAAEGWTIVHPILEWTADQVIAEHKRRGLKLNPLYMLGMGRVGCMPCINVGKDELNQIAKRFPQHIERISEWEGLVSFASKRGWTTFFTDEALVSVVPRAGWRQEQRSKIGKNGEVVSHYDVWIEPDANIYSRCKVEQRVRWAQTSRGGVQFDFTRQEAPTACSSVYGLCE